VYRRSRNRFDVEFLQDTFTIVTNLNYSASIVLGAFGERSNLDIKLKRLYSETIALAWC
jgi:hypothetical protein